MLFRSPGTYDVLAILAPQSGTVPGVAIVAGASTLVNVLIQ